MKTSFIYILTNQHHTVLYIGVTNDLIRRIDEHKKFTVKGFTQKYNINKLVYYEEFEEIMDAIAREKQLKNWNRAWKIELIEKENPDWIDLYEEVCS